jgi:hypothetical protein
MISERAGHAGDDAERDEQAVLGAEHELANARKASDPGGFTEGVLLDVPRRLVAGRCACDHVGLMRRGGGFSAAHYVAGLRPPPLGFVSGHLDPLPISGRRRVLV